MRMYGYVDLQSGKMWMFMQIMIPITANLPIYNINIRSICPRFTTSKIRISAFYWRPRITDNKKI